MWRRRLCCVWLIDHSPKQMCFSADDCLVATSLCPLERPLIALSTLIVVVLFPHAHCLWELRALSRVYLRYLPCCVFKWAKGIVVFITDDRFTWQSSRFCVQTSVIVYIRWLIAGLNSRRLFITQYSEFAYHSAVDLDKISLLCSNCSSLRFSWVVILIPCNRCNRAIRELNGMCVMVFTIDDDKNSIRFRDCWRLCFELLSFCAASCRWLTLNATIIGIIWLH